MKEHPLKQWRDREELSQAALGALLGVDEMTISRWENSVREPQKRHWERIEQVTGLTRGQFLGLAGVAA